MQPFPEGSDNGSERDRVLAYFLFVCLFIFKGEAEK